MTKVFQVVSVVSRRGVTSFQCNVEAVVSSRMFFHLCVFGEFEEAVGMSIAIAGLRNFAEGSSSALSGGLTFVVEVLGGSCVVALEVFNWVEGPIAGRAVSNRSNIFR